MSPTSRQVPTGTPSSFTPTTTAPDAAADARLLDAARAIGPILREHAGEAERQRRLARPALDAIRDAGLLRMYAPRALGGAETDPVTCARVVEEVAGHDSAAGWALQSGNTGAWWCSRLPREGADEIFAAGPDQVLAGAFHPPQAAVEVPGGYRLSGRSPLASAVRDAAWVTVSALVMDGGRPRMTEAGPVVIALSVPAGDVRIVDSWDSLGMRGTDSQDVVTEALFVPAHRTFLLVPGLAPAPRFEGPLYRMPAIASVTSIVVPVALAIARGAITELRELATSKTPMGSLRPLRDRTPVQSALAEAEATLRAARLLFYDTLAATWRRAQAGDGSTLEQRADLLLAGSYAAQSAARVAAAMHRLAGTSGIYARSPLERHFRDAHTVRHHGFVAEIRFEAAGQVYLGVPPEFPLLAL